MKTQITEGIKVSVKTSFVPEQSNAFRFSYLFRYRIMIENQGEYSVQLQRRKWFIFDSCNGLKEVDGVGVIGKCPVIEAGESYEYESFCELTSDMGKMMGYYTMNRQVDGKKIRVNIPDFLLMTPFRFN